VARVGREEGLFRGVLRLLWVMVRSRNVHQVGGRISYEVEALYLLTLFKVAERM